MTHVLVGSLEDCSDSSWRSVCMFCVSATVRYVFKVPLKIQKMPALKINQNLQLEIWSAATLSIINFQHPEMQKCTEGDL